MFSFLWALIVGGIIGAIAGAILGKDVPGGIIGNIIVGFLGSWVASLLLPSLGPVIGGFPIISAFARSDYLYRNLLFYCKPQGVKLYQNDILESIIKLVKVDQTITFDVFSLIF